VFITRISIALLTGLCNKPCRAWKTQRKRARIDCRAAVNALILLVIIFFDLKVTNQKTEIHSLIANSVLLLEIVITVNTSIITS